MKGLYILNQDAYQNIYAEPEREQIAKLADIYAPHQTAEMVQENPKILADADVIYSGWGCPVFDQGLLDSAPNLKVIFYGAGSIKYFVTDALWARRIQVVSAYAALAVPVVEFALAQILLGLKSTWQHALAYRERREGYLRLPVAGGYQSTVGLISLGMIGRMMVERLRTFDLNIIAYDPFVDSYPGVEMVALDEVFQRGDVVSLHTPWLKETEGMITGTHLSMMKPYSTFINTARGAIVREDEMIAVLKDRHDLVAVLDVTYPEPPVYDSPFFTLPNVLLTPHIAGPMEVECRRMGQLMIEECKRYQAGQPMQYSLTRQQVQTMA